MLNLILLQDGYVTDGCYTKLCNVQTTDVYVHRLLDVSVMVDKVTYSKRPLHDAKSVH